LSYAHHEVFKKINYPTSAKGRQLEK